MVGLNRGPLVYADERRSGCYTVGGFEFLRWLRCCRQTKEDVAAEADKRRQGRARTTMWLVRWPNCRDGKTNTTWRT